MENQEELRVKWMKERVSKVEASLQELTDSGLQKGDLIALDLSNPSRPQDGFWSIGEFDSVTRFSRDMFWNSRLNLRSPCYRLLPPANTAIGQIPIIRPHEGEGGILSYQIGDCNFHIGKERIIRALGEDNEMKIYSKIFRSLWEAE